MLLHYGGSAAILVRTGRIVLPDRPAFALACTVAVLLPAASTVPTPVYPLYQQNWNLSATAVTAVFGVYCVVVLASMMLFGSLSDTAGRRRVLILSVVLVGAGMGLFAVADGFWGLLAARAVQGIGGGIGGCAVAAAIIDLAPARIPGLGPLVCSTAPIIGIGVGAGSSGLLVEYAPAPTVLCYVVMLVLLSLAGLALVFLPETAPACGDGSVLAPHRISVPAGSGRTFAALSCPVVAVWAVAGLYMALGPSLAAELLGVGSPALAGLVVGVLAAAGTAGQLAVRRGGRALMVGGLCLVVASLAESSFRLFVLGTVLLGVGWGSTYATAFAALCRLAEPARRGELVAAVNVVAYLGTAVPTFGAGVAVQLAGLHTATVACCLVVGALVLVVKPARR